MAKQYLLNMSDALNRDIRRCAKSLKITQREFIINSVIIGIVKNDGIEKSKKTVSFAKAKGV